MGFRRGNVTSLLPVGGGVSVLSLVMITVAPPVAERSITLVANLCLVLLLWYCIVRTARLPRLTAPTARFWASLARALLVYAAGMGVDLVAAVTQAVSDALVPAYGSQLVYPVAGLFTMYAVFRYPTTAQTRGERITVGLDASIVLLGAASFIWYFTVSRQWTPHLGWLALSETLAVPTMVLVAGFGVIKVALVGVGVIGRVPLACYSACIGLAALATGLPHGTIPLLADTLLMLSQFSALTGAVLQYRLNASGPTRPSRTGGRRAFSILPYTASAAAVLLLVAVLHANLGYRRWGVLGGTGLLLCAVTVRQLIALRENNRLLAVNRTLNEELQHQAWFDELTGLPNRAFYRQRIVEALAGHERDGRETALFLIDLDGFKGVNDTLGHDAGDALLREIAGRLAAEVRANDTVCRLGGDEFVVLIDDADADHVADVADRLVDAVARPVPLAERTVKVGASIGVAFASTSPEPTDLLRRADIAMYAAKTAGKGRWHLAAPAVQAVQPVGSASRAPG